MRKKSSYAILALFLTFFMLTTFLPSGAVCIAAESNSYDVGPGQQYERISDIPWSTLEAGANVRIHYRPESYKEKFVISRSGTAERPIRITGVKGPNGELPVIDGENAISHSEDYFDSFLNEISLILIAPRPGFTWGYKPKNIVIEGLELKNTDSSHSYTIDGESSKNYYRFSSAIYGERVENLTVRNCVIHDNSLGVFVNSKGGEEQQSRNILIEGNRFNGNGVVGDYSEHNSYI